MSLIKFSAFALAVIVAAGCDSTGAATATDSGEKVSINNSDPRKDSYRPADESDKKRKDAKRQIALAPQSNGIPSDILARSEAADVPVVAALSEEPWVSGTSGYSPLLGNEFWIFMDTETNDNADHVRSGNAWDGINYGARVLEQSSQLVAPGRLYTSIFGVTFTTQHNRGILMRFMMKETGYLPKLRYDYIVLRLSQTCPENGIPFSQHFDNEDVNNQDWATRDLAPGWSSRLATGTTLAFCFVPKATSNPQDSRALLGVFGNSALAVFADGMSGKQIAPGVYDADILRTNTLVVDSEDTDFAGHFRWEGMSPENQAKVQQIMLISSAAQTPFLSITNLAQAVGH